MEGKLGGGWLSGFQKTANTCCCLHGDCGGHNPFFTPAGFECCKFILITSGNDHQLNAKSDHSQICLWLGGFSTLTEALVANLPWFWDPGLLLKSVKLGKSCKRLVNFRKCKTQWSKRPFLPEIFNLICWQMHPVIIFSLEYDAMVSLCNISQRWDMKAHRPDSKFQYWNVWSFVMFCFYVSCLFLCQHGVSQLGLL